MTKGEAIDADPYLSTHTFDSALPQDWVDDVYRVTGVYPAAFFVWVYDEHARTWGRPYPLTPEAEDILATYIAHKEVSR